MQLKAVDFFCGAGGMSYGLRTAGIDVLAGIDCNESCCETYERNNAPARFINADITEVSPRSLSRRLRVSRYDDSVIFVGCSPCQFWSKMNTDKRKSRKSIFLLTEFERFVDWFRPGFVLIENVPGLQSKKRPAILPQFKKFLRQRDYAIAHGVINAVDYGVPQKRKRYLLIATRLTKRIEMPAPSGTKLHVRDRIGPHNGFAQIKAGHSDNTMFRHSAAALSPMNQQRISRTPVDGGTRASWRGDAELQIPAYKGKDRNFTDVYGRMFWDKPAPTITTRFNSLSNGRFGHPQENRAISLREGAVLQSFPKRYVFRGGNAAEIARQIGNAVPPALARRVGTHLLRVFRDSQKVARD